MKPAETINKYNFLSSFIQVAVADGDGFNQFYEIFAKCFELYLTQQMF